MNKKFLSAILFGALMVTSTGTFVSCKDYDDDIENLQEQINNLATKSDVEAKLAQLQAALNAAQSEATSAKATAAEALEKANSIAATATDAEKAAAEASKAAAQAALDAAAAKEEAIKAAQEEVAKAQEALQETIAADFEAFVKKVEALDEKVEALVGKIADFVTSVELVSSYTHEAEWPLALDFYTITEKENVFEENIAGAIKFEKGKQTQVAQTPILVRVSPTNAVLSAEMISLVNSKGENLDEYVDIAVAPYSKLMTYVPETNVKTTSRAAENNGLWEVKVTLKEYNEKQFKALKAVEEGTVLYAVQINNALSSAETRYVTSSYDVTLGEHGEFEAADNLLFTVDGTSVEKINNRFTNTSLSLKEQGKAEMYAELDWANAPATEPILKGDKKNVTEADDDRSAENLALAVQGTPLTIAISDDIKNQVRAIYVTLDKANAVESAPSELNAWNSYEYEGLNKVVEGTSTKITINGKETINDIIGFRVYAVNYDGTLVDPDGKAFYVLVGDQAQELNVVETSIIPVNETIVPTEAVVAEALADLEGVVNFTWTVDEGDDVVPFDLCFYKKDAKEYFSRIATGQTSTQTNINDVAKIASIPATDKAWYDYKDGETYYGTLKAYDTNGFVVATLRVSFTKNIPAGAPEGFSIKTSQVENGIYNCYMIPMAGETESWAVKSADNGSMKMTEVFNFPEGLAANYSIKFATSAVDEDGAYTIAKTVAGDAAIIVDADLIDNETKHATTATYNYGKISSEAKDKDGNIINYVVDVTEVNFETVYNCIYNSTYTWNWATDAERTLIGTVDGVDYTAKSNGAYVNALPSTELTYGTDTNWHVDCFIMGVSAWDGLYSAILNAPYEKSIHIVDATLTSDANGKEEYFDVVLEGNHIKGFKAINLSSTTNPTAAIPSTLTIKCADMYDHEVVIKVAMTVNKR